MEGRPLVKMAWKIEAVLTSSHGHIKIKTKLQNNHHWASPEVLRLRTYTRGHIKTSKKDGDVK